MLILLAFLFVQSGLCAEMKQISSSRANAVLVKVPSLDSAGTAFFLDGEHIITAFHVVGKVNIDKSITPPKFQITTGTDISIILETGEEIAAQVIAPRLTQTSFNLTDVLPESFSVPITKDFAILKLRQKPKSLIIPNPLLRGKPLPSIGSEVIFSGYPLKAPTMLTHKGMISGITDDKAVICIEAPINKGNSGGSLLNEQGEVIGIITNREGGISKGLEELVVYINETQKHGSVALMGVNPLEVIKELIKTLDIYISPGIGYARTIKHVVDYIDRNPEILK
jgi:S1-C subfamily serine protease